MRQAEDPEAEVEKRLAELEGRAAALRRRRGELNREAERWKETRDRLNESVRALRTEARKHREERDRANQRVAEIKARIEDLRHDLTEKRGTLTEAEEDLERRRKGLPPRREVEERLSRIEWEIMTTPTADMMDREKALAEEGRRLRDALAAHEALDAREDERLKMLADIKAVELEIRGCRDEVSRLHETSEENHEKMILLYRRADEEQGRADDAHAKFLENISAVRAVEGELREVRGEIRRLQKGLREADRQVSAEKERRIEVRKRELRMEVKRKLEAGAKLSLDELRLLYGEEGEEK